MGSRVAEYHAGATEAMMTTSSAVIARATRNRHGGVASNHGCGNADPDHRLGPVGADLSESFNEMVWQMVHHVQPSSMVSSQASATVGV